MSTRIVLAFLAAAGLALVVALLVGLDNDDAPPTVTAASAPSRAATVFAARPRRVSVTVEPSAVAADDDAEVPLAPLLDPDAFDRARTAVMPGLRGCTTAVAARHVGATGRLAVTYRLEARAGRIRVVDAGASLTGLEDEDLATCVAQAARTADVEAPVEQPDGVQQITIFASIP